MEVTPCRSDVRFNFRTPPNPTSVFTSEYGGVGIFNIHWEGLCTSPLPFRFSFIIPDGRTGRMGGSESHLLPHTSSEKTKKYTPPGSGPPSSTNYTSRVPRTQPSSQFSLGRDYEWTLSDLVKYLLEKRGQLYKYKETLVHGGISRDTSGTSYQITYIFYELFIYNLIVSDITSQYH